MPSNSAAWLRRPYGPLEVGPAERPRPGAGEILLRARAVAVNPLDDIKQSTGDLMYRWLPYPAVLGEDVAGEVVEVGPGVTRFTAGDRVVAYAVGMEKGRRHEAEGAFQQHVVVRADLACPVPDGLDLAQAAVLPLGASTAASALFQQDQLGLRHPGAGVPASDDSVVVWGASTSVGSNAVQLAVAAGYRVIATASPRNHKRARALGAAAVVDYADRDAAVRGIAAAAQGTRVRGVLAIGTGSAEPSVSVAIATGATRVALASPSVSLAGLPQRRVSPQLAALGARLVAGNVALQVRARRYGIRVRFVWGSSLMGNEVGPMLWEGFLPAALADGRYVAAPQARVVGEGLAAIQPALEALRRGVSAEKLVVRL